MPDSMELIRRYAENSDQDAFAELVRGHADLVYAVALRQVAADTHLAEEVIQEVFLILARKSASLTQRATLNGWLYGHAKLAASRPADAGLHPERSDGGR